MRKRGKLTVANWDPLVYMGFDSPFSRIVDFLSIRDLWSGFISVSRYFKSIVYIALTSGIKREFVRKTRYLNKFVDKVRKFKKVHVTTLHKQLKAAIKDLNIGKIEEILQDKDLNLIDDDFLAVVNIDNYKIV